MERYYKVRIKGKVEHPENGVVASPTVRCSSYWKGSLWVALDNGHQLYSLIYRYIYIREFGIKWATYTIKQNKQTNQTLFYKKFKTIYIG